MYTDLVFLLPFSCFSPSPLPFPIYYFNTLTWNLWPTDCTTFCLLPTNTSPHSIQYLMHMHYFFNVKTRHRPPPQPHYRIPFSIMNNITHLHDPTTVFAIPVELPRCGHVQPPLSCLRSFPVPSSLRCLPLLS